ncbi:sulfur carrier protein ThiS [Simkania negevensis]|uniref:Sulfur carrier protein ThiS n=1 Tax=Simkania negevensis TaxID=83561 RepID=A0ABS3AS72_9BACT|nr:sulfur carrier protein ThiS [Simkania negevensis]
MIAVKYNEKKQIVGDNLSLEQLLKTMGIVAHTAKGIAVAHNQTVVPRDQWGSLFLQEGDQIDVLQAIQGG